MVVSNVIASSQLDTPTCHYLQKLGDSAIKAMAQNALLHHDNQILTRQNAEKASQKGQNSAQLGKARLLSEDDILEAQISRQLVRLLLLDQPPRQDEAKKQPIDFDAWVSHYNDEIFEELAMETIDRLEP